MWKIDRKGLRPYSESCTSSGKINRTGSHKSKAAAESDLDAFSGCRRSGREESFLFGFALTQGNGLAVARAREEKVKLR